MADTDQYWLKRIAEDPRTKQGLPPTIGSSQEEKDAYEAYIKLPFVESGDLSVADLPTSYGGRPKGSSRRAMRMQFEWDKAQEQQLQNQRIMQQMEESDVRMEELERQRNVEMVAAAREGKVKEQSQKFMEAFIGATLPDGSRTKPIDINDDGAVESIQRQMYMNPFAMENQYIKDMATMMLDDAVKVRQSKIAQTQKQSEQQQSWLVGQQEEAASVGVDASKFFTTKVDPATNQTVVTGVDRLGLSKAIGEAKRKDAENKQKEIASANVSEEIRTEAKDVLKSIEGVDKQIREQNFMASREKSEANRDEYLAKAEYLRGERDVLVTRYGNLIPKQQEETQPQAEAARPQQRELTQRDQSALNWANANPNDPRSQRIKARLGVE